MSLVVSVQGRVDSMLPVASVLPMVGSMLSVAGVLSMHMVHSVLPVAGGFC